MVIFPVDRRYPYCTYHAQPHIRRPGVQAYALV